MVCSNGSNAEGPHKGAFGILGITPKLSFNPRLRGKFYLPLPRKRNKEKK